MNGAALAGPAAHTLRPGDRIRFGPASLYQLQVIVLSLVAAALPTLASSPRWPVLDTHRPLQLPPPPAAWLAVAATKPHPAAVPAGQTAGLVARAAAALRLPAGLSVTEAIAAAAELLWLRLPSPATEHHSDGGLLWPQQWSGHELRVNAAAVGDRLGLGSASASASGSASAGLPGPAPSEPSQGAAGMPPWAGRSRPGTKAPTDASQPSSRTVFGRAHSCRILCPSSGGGLPADFEVVEALAVRTGPEPEAGLAGWLAAGVVVRVVGSAAARLQLADQQGWVDARGRGGAARVLRRLPSPVVHPTTLPGEEEVGFQSTQQALRAGMAEPPAAVDVFGAAFKASAELEEAKEVEGGEWAVGVEETDGDWEEAEPATAGLQDLL